MTYIGQKGLIINNMDVFCYYRGFNSV